MNLKSIISDAAERSISTGWQVAAGYAIATEVFHDATLTPVVAAALSVAKSLAVKFYTEHKTEADKIRAQVEPIVEAAIKEYRSASEVSKPITEIKVDSQSADALKAAQAVDGRPSLADRVLAASSGAR